LEKELRSGECTTSTFGFGSEETTSVIACAAASVLQLGSRVSSVPPQPSTSRFRYAAQPCAKSKPIAIGTSTTRLPFSAPA
jgi:hypothetical protein